MSFTLFKKVFRDKFKNILWYGLGLFAYSYMMAAMYPSFKDTTGYESIIDALPKGFKVAFGITTVDFTFSQFMGMEFLSLMWGLIVLFFISFFTAGMIAEEIEKGTIELLLARPISRIKIALTKISVFVFGLIILIGFTLLGMFIPNLHLDLDIAWMPLFRTMLVLFCFSLAIFGYSFFFSSFQSEKGKVIVFSAALWIIFYFMNFASKFWQGVEWIGNYSLFYYYRYSDLLIGEPIKLGDVLIYLAVFIVGTVIGLIVFQKRDIAIK